jgi:predicted nucleic acid-binding protein
VTKQMSDERAGQLLGALIDLPITRHRHLSLLARAISLRHNFTVYDGVYVALAESLGATLVTGDQKLAAAARQHTSLDVVSG